ncbi:MAG TPA: NADH dehydrogenase (quinone) subunit G [Actinobacteria bacterium]|nr:NADH dehydrogenase (quinone) subunit G [Actinomycetota bacterium]
MADAPDQVSITLDGRVVEVPRGALLIAAAIEAGTYIPHFCWHPRMKPVGMCRMCLVEIDTPRGKMLTTSCTTPVADGMVVETSSPVVKKAQEGVIEFLLINHPLDCPVCDKGGECPLQDQTLAYGPGDGRFVEEKRHYPKPIPISDLVALDRERCILCARCTRFSEEISGDPLIEFVDRGNHVEVNTFPNHPFTSYFSGNTVQICPVGALTARPYRFRARPWDLEAVEAVSTVDSVHSKVSLEASMNEIVRISGVDCDPTNQGWLSDKDRFVYEHLLADDRVVVPLIANGDGFREASWGEAVGLAASRLADLGGAVAGLGGARSTNEDAYVFSRFLRGVVGTPHLDAQLDDGLAPEFAAAVEPRALIDDLDDADAILLWGPDLKEELPVLYLRVRKAATAGAKLVVVHPRRTGLDDVAAHTIRYRPGEGPALLRRLAAGEGDLAEARDALGAGKVVALVGRPGLAEPAELAEAVAAFALTLDDARILPLVRRGNVFGALDMGLAPTLLPGRVSVDDAERRRALAARWGSLPDGVGMGATDILEAAASGRIGALVLLGVDPVRDHPRPDLARRALERAFVVALDLFVTDSTRHADVVLPVAGLGEIQGTVTNLEGRVQKLNRVVPPPGQARPAWSILDDLAAALGSELEADAVEKIFEELATLAPAYEGLTWDRFDWAEGRDGVVVPLEGVTPPLRHVPSDPGLAVVSERPALHLARVLYDDGVLVRHCPSLASLAPEAAAHLHPRDASVLAVREGDRVRLEGVGVVELPVVLDPTLAEGTVYVPFNLAETAALGAVPSVRIDVVREAGS